jgi:hypothetical protein
VKAFIDVELGVVLPEAGMVGLDGVPPIGEKGQAPQAVDGFSAQGAIGLQIRARIEHQHPQSRFRQHHGGHTPTGPGPHHNYIHWIARGQEPSL